jgi:hypothetical protein
VTVPLPVRLPAKAWTKVAPPESDGAVNDEAAADEPVAGEPVAGEAIAGEAVTDEAFADEGSSAAPDGKTGPAARRTANRNAQRAEAQAALVALRRDVVAARRKALSTSTGIAAVALAGLVAYGLGARNGAILASAAVPFLLIACFLCWPRERTLTRTEYLSLPHTQGRNGRLRCIHCSTLGIGLAEIQALQAGRQECPKCKELLFSS